MISKDFIYYKTLNAYNTAKADGDISNKSIVFVEENSTIHTHGHQFGGGTTPYKFDKIASYLYESTYDSLDYDFAQQYIKEHYKQKLGACSTVRIGDYILRKYDWYYSNAASYVIHVGSTPTRHASISIGGGIDKFTPGFITSGAYDDIYRVLPFLVVDGMNDAGLTISTLVVPTGDNGATTGTNPGKEDLCTMMIPRYVLDHFSTAKSACNYISKEVNVYAPILPGIGLQEVHFFISDKSGATYVLEFINNTAVCTVLTDNRKIVTNFYLEGVAFNDDHSVYTNADVTDGNLPTYKNLITDHGSGLERYNLINSFIENIDHDVEESDMLFLSKQLNYTNSYKEEPGRPYWYSEFVGQYSSGNVTVDTPIDDDVMLDVVSTAKNNFINRDRNDHKTWQSVHSVIYNPTELSATVTVQELDTIYKFNVKRTSFIDITEHNGKLIITK